MSKTKDNLIAHWEDFNFKEDSETLADIITRGQDQAELHEEDKIINMGLDRPNLSEAEESARDHYWQNLGLI